MSWRRRISLPAKHEGLDRITSHGARSSRAACPAALARSSAFGCEPGGATCSRQYASALGGVRGPGRQILELVRQRRDRARIGTCEPAPTRRAYLDRLHRGARFQELRPLPRPLLAELACSAQARTVSTVRIGREELPVAPGAGEGVVLAVAALPAPTRAAGGPAGSR